MGAVVGCCVFGEEACSWRRYEGVAQVGEDFCLAGSVKNDAYSEFVGGAFAAEGDVGGFVFEGHFVCEVEDGKFKGGGIEMMVLMSLPQLHGRCQLYCQSFEQKYRGIYKQYNYY